MGGDGVNGFGQESVTVILNKIRNVSTVNIPFAYLELNSKMRNETFGMFGMEICVG